MTKRRHLLPHNSTPLERALSLAAGPWTTGDETIESLQDPSRIPAELLPHLALAEDVPLWPDGDAERRAIIAASPRLHALIGTPKGLRELARLAGARIERLERPPAKTFLGYWDADSRAQWLAAHPEMRLRTQRERSAAEGLMLGRAFVGVPGEPPARTSALARSAVRAEIRWPDGRVQPLTTYGWSALDQEREASVGLARRAAARGLHLGGPLSGMVTSPDAANRYWCVETVRWRERGQLLMLKQTVPSLQPLSPDAELVAERGLRPQVLCAGLPLAGFTTRSDSGQRMYSRIRLHDPDVAARPKHGPSYLGFTRLSSPPFVSLVHVRMPTRRQPVAMAGAGMRAPLSAGDARDRMAGPLDAMDWARAPHDKVLVRTRLHVTARASRIYRAGSVLAGQTINRS